MELKYRFLKRSFGESNPNRIALLKIREVDDIVVVEDNATVVINGDTSSNFHS